MSGIAFCKDMIVLKIILELKQINFTYISDDNLHKHLSSFQ